MGRIGRHFESSLPEPAEVIVTVQVTVNPPSAVVPVIVAVPAARAVTRPPALTSATSGLLEVHVIVLLVAFSGSNVTTS